MEEERTAVGARGHRSAVLAGALSAMGMLPVVLVGAVAPYLPASLDIGPREVGFMSSGFFLVGGLGTWITGPLVDRAHWRTSLRIACVVSLACMFTVGVSVPSGVGLAALTVTAGVAFAISMPAATVVLSRTPGSNAFAFGLKQAAMPASTLVAGLVVPPLAARGPWSLPYLVCAAVPLCLLLVVGRGTTEAPTAPSRRGAGGEAALGGVDVRWLVLVMSMASLIPGSLVAFTVSSAVASGLDVAAAGWVLSASSLLGMASRVGVGRIVDRMGWEPLRTSAWLLALGSSSVLLLAAPSPTMAVIGSLAAFVFGWGWPGVLFFGVVRWFPDTPAGVTGRVQTGGSIGTAVGPLLLGLLVERSGYGIAWVIVGVVGALAAILLLRIIPRPVPARVITGRP